MDVPVQVNHSFNQPKIPICSQYHYALEVLSSARGAQTDSSLQSQTSVTLSCYTLKESGVRFFLKIRNSFMVSKTTQLFTYSAILASFCSFGQSLPKADKIETL